MRFICLTLGLFVLPAAALAQTAPPRTYTFQLTVPADIASLMLNKLSELPWKDINPVLQVLSGQVNTQNASPSPPPPAEQPSGSQGKPSE